MREGLLFAICIVIYITIIKLLFKYQSKVLFNSLFIYININYIFISIFISISASAIINKILLKKYWGIILTLKKSIKISEIY